ncbi:MAG: Na+/H+ antiporter NhaA [Pseudomonadota bacterium]
MPLSALRRFFRLESAAGLILIGAAALALVVENSWLAHLYDHFLTLPVAIQIGALVIKKPLLLWINDGLMAVFFLLVGLEVKRELVEGELSSKEQVTLPVIGALGGMAVPAAIYVLFNASDPVALQGWAVPAATDIAFALGVMMLLGDKVPIQLKILLTTIAVFDDLGAIGIIAAFYTSDLSIASLGFAGLAMIVLLALNQRGVTSLTPYILTGIVLWVAVLKSGVHATLAGVALGFAIPLRRRNAAGQSPLKNLEDALHPWVAYGVLPLFAFANAGLPLAGLALADLVHPVSLGIGMGLFLGKQLGIFTLAFIAIKLGLARLPERVGWLGLYGVAVLAGVGFTMSLFIGTLAFDGVEAANRVRLGVLLGSLSSALLGYYVLRLAGQRQATPLTSG